jgi:hypothetical protein
LLVHRDTRLIDDKVEIPLRFDGEVFVDKLKGDQGVRALPELLDVPDFAPSKESPLKKVPH